MCLDSYNAGINDMRPWIDAALAYRELAAYYNGRRSLDDDLRERLKKADALVELNADRPATPTEQIMATRREVTVSGVGTATPTDEQQGTTGHDGRAHAAAGQQVKVETCGQCEHLSAQPYANQPDWYPCSERTDPRRKTDPVCSLKEELEEWKATTRALLDATKSQDNSQQRNNVQHHTTDNDDSLSLLDERIAREDIEAQLDLTAIDYKRLAHPDTSWPERLELVDRFLDAVKHTDNLSLKKK